MLRTLTIRDFVIVDELELEFSGGFTVFSGETGAGKSILIDALALTLGERADASIVREGAQRCDVTAEFATAPEAEAWLSTQELGNNGSALLRRSVDASGRSKAWINGAPVTLTQLRELGELLVDIHGQHAHQSLLRADAQRVLLDTQAGLTADARALAEAWRNWQKIAAQLKELQSNSRNLQLERERLEWQVKELQQLALKPGEWQEIQQEHQRLAHAASLLEGAQLALEGLSEADHALLPQLSVIHHKLAQLADIDSALKPVIEALEPAQIQLQEAVYSLNDYLGRVELDPERLAEAEARIAAIHSTARKFRLAPDDLIGELASLSEQLGTLQGASDLEGLIAQEQQAEASYRKLAATLTKARTKTAKALAAAITEGMQSLSMSGGRFEIALHPMAPTASGMEQVEFLVAAHAGATPRALAKVASGGELARISLAISVIASTATTVPTLIFDEVDSGIGGAVAEVVGKLLRQLGRMRQVLCVTHLPQVAAQGETHFAVSKATITTDDAEVSAPRTVSRISVLNPNGRVDEVARMLGGIDITATTRKHARELLAST
jgi:DNA repair protein RecN (Recombination protein N)